jgi:4-carboxymuconolactone decarboxylase
MSIGEAQVTDGDRALIQVSAALASGDDEALTHAFSHARNAAEDSEVEEVLLQSYLFLGFPAALNGMAAWRRLIGQGSTGEASLDYSSWEERGHDVCAAVYSGQHERLRENVRALHPDLEQWMVVEGYGKVLGRPGLSLMIRELCIVATLTVTGALKQLHSHLRGAMNVGAVPADVDVALAEAERFLDDEGRRTAAALWEKVQKRHIP